MGKLRARRKEASGCQHGVAGGRVSWLLSLADNQLATSTRLAMGIAPESIDAAREVVLLRTQCMGAVNDFIVLSHRGSHELVMTCARMLLIDAHENGRVVLPANKSSALLRSSLEPREHGVLKMTAAASEEHIAHALDKILRCDLDSNIPLIA